MLGICFYQGYSENKYLEIEIRGQLNRHALFESRLQGFHLLLQLSDVHVVNLAALGKVGNQGDWRMLPFKL